MGRAGSFLSKTKFERTLHINSVTFPPSGLYGSSKLPCNLPRCQDNTSSIVLLCPERHSRRFCGLYLLCQTLVYNIGKLKQCWKYLRKEQKWSRTARTTIYSFEMKVSMVCTVCMYLHLLYVGYAWYVCAVCAVCISMCSMHCTCDVWYVHHVR